MKKTIVAVACAALISTGAMAKPMGHNHAPKPHNDHHGVQMVDKHAPRPAPHHASVHHRPQPIIVHSRPTPPPAAPMHHHHHHHNSFDFGDALIAFAILATAF